MKKKESFPVISLQGRSPIPRFRSVVCLAVICLLSVCVTQRVQATSFAAPDRPSARILTEPEQRKYDYFFLEATRLKNKQEYAAAFSLYQHALSIYPDGSAALYEIAQFYLFLRQMTRGQEALEKAVALDPDNFWYNQALVGLYESQDKPEEATALLEDMMARFPFKQDPLFALIDIYNRQQDYPNVIRILDRLEEQMGKNEQLSMEKFRIYLLMKDETRAFREIENLVEEYPMDTRYKVLLGDVYLQNGKTQPAYELYQEVLKEEPDNAMAIYSLVVYYEETGQQELYQQYLDALLLNSKVPSDTKLNVMRQLIVQNEQQEPDSTRILSLFDRMLKADEEDDQIAMLYAQYLISKGMDDQVDPVLEHVLEIDPTNTAARMMLLGTAIRENDYERVIALCEPGIEASPATLEFYFYLAIAYMQSGRWEDVVRVSRGALENAAEDANSEVLSDFYTLLGDASHTLGYNQEAYEAYDSALVYNSSNIGALNNYAYYLSLERKDLDRAEEMSYKTIKAESDNGTYLDTYAWILFEKGNYAEARIYIDQAMKNGGQESDVVVEHCGDIYAMTGEPEKALEYWKQAREMGSESKTLNEKIKRKKYIAP